MTESTLERWFRSPLLFVRECLGVEVVDDWQVEGLNAVRDCKRTCVKAAKGCGKSTLEAWVIWWFLATRPHPKILATSITGDNLRDGLWAELSKWQQRSEYLTRFFTWSAERIVYNEFPETWFCSARQWSKTADPGQQSNTLAGIHADYTLVIADEAGGIPDSVVAAAEGALSTGKENKILICGNPTHLEGPLWRACTSERALWHVIEVTGDPHDPRRSKRIDRQWCLDQIAKYGIDNPWVLVNVFGRFPPASSDALIGIEVATNASTRTLALAEYLSEPKVIGVDCARFGDDRTVFFPRQGRAAYQYSEFRGIDTMETVGQLTLAVQAWKPDAVFIDVGGVGGGVVDRMRQLGFDVFAVDFGSKSSLGRYHNKRAECWGLMAEWYERASTPRSNQLISEVTAPKYKFSQTNRIVLESKADMKARGLVSPDLADALALTFAAPVAPKGLEWVSPSRANMALEYDPLARS